MRRPQPSPARPVLRGPGRSAREALLDEVLAGLSRRAPALPSHLFYDARGSQLFQWITNLPGYYPTQVEREILSAHAAEVVAPLAGRPCTVVDLGAGDGHKTALLLRALAGAVPRLGYAPVDVSRAALDEACARAAAAVPGVEARPLQATYAAALGRLGREGVGEARLALFLGSSIGNLEHAEARRLLRGLRRALRPGDHLLVGFDLVKPLDVLFAAYDDPQGVTRAFNLNLLTRLNRELGADFDVSAFDHVASWDPVRPAMESWLEPRRAVEVHLGGRTLRLAAGQRIHTEISCKYAPAQIDAFAVDAGFEAVRSFTDRRGWFVDALWRVAP
jgi:L-histidine N-alpha-methyltransferase